MTLFLALLSTGCYSYHRFAVRVLDAESHQPVAGANVKVFYLTYLDPVPPKESTSVTDPAGTAVLKIASDTVPAEVIAEAPMYKSGDSGILSWETIRHLQINAELGVPELRFELKKAPNSPHRTD